MCKNQCDSADIFTNYDKLWAIVLVIEYISHLRECTAKVQWNLINWIYKSDSMRRYLGPNNAGNTLKNVLSRFIPKLLFNYITDVISCF